LGRSGEGRSQRVILNCDGTDAQELQAVLGDLIQLAEEEGSAQADGVDRDAEEVESSDESEASASRAVQG
jgi:hypothetical protein